MKFKVGDVVEVLWVFKPENAALIGKTGSVLSIGNHFWGPTVGNRTDGLQVTLDEYGRFTPEQLRLKRPPTWDKWLYDTSDVKDEKRIGMPA